MTESRGPLHAGEHVAEPLLVRRLVASQFPEWAGLRVRRVASSGTDHAVFRLGKDLAVRLPRIPSAALQVEKLHRWLPLLAPRLPLDVPVPVALGAPAEGYAWPWSVCRWLPGSDGASAIVADPKRAACDLGRFVAALHAIDASGGPPPGEHNAFRGAPLESCDDDARAAIRALRGEVDERRAVRAWDAALATPSRRDRPRWVHGDLHPANLLVRRRRLTAVLDFGLLGCGDPAHDVMAAWTCVPAESRAAFRAACAADDPTWARGRGWALHFGLIALPYYRDTNPILARLARAAIAAALADVGADVGADDAARDVAGRRCGVRPRLTRP